MVHLLNDLLHIHRSWKHIALSELTELYISMMIKTLGLSFIGIFIPVYLYQLGYSVPTIATFFICLYGFRFFADIASAFLVGYIGPKKTMIISHLYLIVSLAMLLALEYADLSIYLIAIVNGAAYSMFFVAYHIEFSKIQTARKAGREIGTMFQVGKVAGAIGPLFGGIIAQFYGVGAVIVVAIGLILVSAAPLLASPEPVRKYQHITFRDFPWRRARANLAANFGGSFDQMAHLFYWPLFVSIFIFVDNVYLGVGALTSLGLIASIFAAKMYGKMIDSRKTTDLMRYGIIGSALMNIFRVFTGSPAMAAGVNLAADPLGIAYRMPYTKIVYQEASSYEGYRDAYIAVLMTSANIARTLSWVIVYLAAVVVSDRFSLQLSFVIAAVAVLGVLHAREVRK